MGQKAVKVGGFKVPTQDVSGVLGSVRNDVMTVCWDPFKARDAKIGRLYPIADEVWDLRSQAPPPGLRVFCRFAEKDVLVALTCRY